MSGDDERSMGVTAEDIIRLLDLHPHLASPGWR